MSTVLGAQPRTIRRVVHPAVKTTPSIELYEVTPERHHTLRIVSSTLYSVYVHQVGRRPLPCYGEDGCDCEHRHHPLRRQHYLYVVADGSTKLRMVRLTSGLVYQEVPALVEEGRDLAGETIELWREYPSKPDSAMLGQLLDVKNVTIAKMETPPIEWAVDRMLSAPDRKSPWRQKRPVAPVARPTVLTSPAMDAEDFKLTRIANTVQLFKIGLKDKTSASAILKDLGADVGILDR